MFSLRPDVIPLFLLAGGFLFLLFHEVLLIRKAAAERFGPWAFTWTILGLVFTTARILQRTLTIEALIGETVRVQYAVGALGGWVFVGTIRALANQEVRTRPNLALLGVGVTLAALALFTPWIVTDETFLRSDALGTSYLAARPGPMLGAIGVYVVVCAALCVSALRHLHPVPVSAAIATGLGATFALNDLLLTSGLVPTIPLFEYTFGCIAIVGSVYLARRVEGLTHDLEHAVGERTEALRRSEHRFRELSEATFEGVVVHRDGVIFDGNEALARIFRKPSESFLGQAVVDLFEPDARVQVERALAGDQESSLQVTGTRSDGERFPAELEWRSDQAAADGARVLVVRDVTEQQKIQQHLIRADRLASMGTLAAGTAHEINNPLAYAVVSAQLLAEELRRLDEQLPAGTLDDARQLLGEVEEGASRVRRIVRDLMAVAREPDAEVGAVDIAHVIEASAQLARTELRHRARVVLDFAEVPNVRGNEHRLVQVFLNLLVNAAHAIPEGHADEHEVRVTVTRKDRRHVLVEVRDDGEGMTAELAEHIFDPFFTTKPVGHGTGLGLAIGHGIVSSVGGRMWVESTPGQGSTFSVLLPVGRERALSTRSRQHSLIPAPELSRRVLVVDDEPGVARALKRALRTHDVVVARSGREALERCQSGEFDVIVCDLMMPELTGMDVHRALQERDPALANRMIFMTGGVFTESARKFLEHVENPVFDKPLDVKRLRAAVSTTAEKNTPIRSARL